MNFQSSLKKRKGIVSFTERTLESFETLQKGPWLKGEEGRGGAGRVSARRVAGGEGQGARELQ